MQLSTLLTSASPEDRGHKESALNRFRLQPITAFLEKPLKLYRPSADGNRENMELNQKC